MQWQQEVTLNGNYGANRLCLDPNQGFGRNARPPLKDTEERRAEDGATHSDDDGEEYRAEHLRFAHTYDCRHARLAHVFVSLHNWGRVRQALHTVLHCTAMHCPSLLPLAPHMSLKPAPPGMPVTSPLPQSCARHAIWSARRAVPCPNA